jgi:hypothetical protein
VRRGIGKEPEAREPSGGNGALRGKSRPDLNGRIDSEKPSFFMDELI